MKSIANKTQKPLSVPLPRGKTLHLGPGKTGQISSEAAEHPPLAKLVHAGEIEVFDDGPASTGEPGAAGRAVGRFTATQGAAEVAVAATPECHHELTHVASCQESTGLACGSAGGGRLSCVLNGQPTGMPAIRDTGVNAAPRPRPRARLAAVRSRSGSAPPPSGAHPRRDLSWRRCHRVSHPTSVANGVPAPDPDVAC